MKALKENKLVIIDEINKMEVVSDKFKKTVELALNSKNKVLGTIKLNPDSFVNKIKSREDSKIFCLNKESKNEIKREIISWLQSN